MIARERLTRPDADTKSRDDHSGQRLRNAHRHVETATATLRGSRKSGGKKKWRNPHKPLASGGSARERGEEGEGGFLRRETAKLFARAPKLPSLNPPKSPIP